MSGTDNQEPVTRDQLMADLKLLASLIPEEKQDDNTYAAADRLFRALVADRDPSKDG